MMCEYSNVCYEAVNYIVTESDTGNGNVSYDASSWFDEKPIIQKNNPLANLPYVEDNGIIISQTNACLLHLGEKFGLLGTSNQERIECEQVFFILSPLHSFLILRMYYATKLQILSPLL